MATTKKKSVKMITEIKLKNFTPEELEMISYIKTYTGEKTAVGAFKSMLMHYTKILNDYGNLTLKISELNELKFHIQEINKLAFKK